MQLPELAHWIGGSGRIAPSVSEENGMQFDQYQQSMSNSWSYR